MRVIFQVPPLLKYLLLRTVPEKKLVFSGDLGNSLAALLRDPEIVEQADVLFLSLPTVIATISNTMQTLQRFEDIIDEASKIPR